MSGPVKRPMVLAVASGGGHWIQLLRLRAAFGEVDVVYATTYPDHREVVGTARFCLVPEANRWESMRLVRRADLREHRNDHQLATASRLSALDREAVAADETALVASLDAATADAPSKRIGPDADAALIAELSDFIAQPDRAND